jgi:predicted ATP-grasp superfamily ATP-dependent carboligase
LISEIERIRARNNGAWMDLVRLAWKEAPDEARKISAAITENDAAILELSKEMAQPREAPVVRNGVLIPGGGILHTYAVKEALALGLVPIVTDRDPKCPCASIPGVVFHEMDCYDTESHVAFTTKHKTGLIGAFCGGAETHEQVAAAADVLGSTWVKPRTSRICRDKTTCKLTLLDAAIPTAKFVERGPAIFKPARGSGSRGVRRCLVSSGTTGGHFEEILEGPEQSVEILMVPGRQWHGVNVVDRYFAWVDDQPLEWGHTNPARLAEDQISELYKLTYNTARAVGADVGFFKCDTIWTKDGPKVLECTPRLSGGFDSQLSTPWSSGRNLLRYGLQLACGLPLDDSLLEHKRRESVTVIHRPHLATL